MRGVAGERIVRNKEHSEVKDVFGGKAPSIVRRIKFSDADTSFEKTRGGMIYDATNTGDAQDWNA